MLPPPAPLAPVALSDMLDPRLVRPPDADPHSAISADPVRDDRWVVPPSSISEARSVELVAAAAEARLERRGAPPPPRQWPTCGPIAATAAGEPEKLR